MAKWEKRDAASFEQDGLTLHLAEITPGNYTGSVSYGADVDLEADCMLDAREVLTHATANKLRQLADSLLTTLDAVPNYTPVNRKADE